MAANTEYARLDMVDAETLSRVLSATPLPTTTSTDNGKVLGVKSGKWAKVTPAEELPAVTAADNGKVLMVVDGAWAVGELEG